MKIIAGNILDVESGIILHQVNCQGVMGAGVAKALSDKYPVLKSEYQYHCRFTAPSRVFGTILTVGVGRALYVANVFAQFNYGTEKRQTNYGALASALNFFPSLKTQDEGVVYAPYGMGCGLAGGDWETYSEILEFYVPNITIVKYEGESK